MNEDILFAENLSFLRRVHGMSRNELANHTSVSSMTILNYEKKKTSPTIQFVDQASKIFKVSLPKLIYSNLERETNFSK